MRIKLDENLRIRLASRLKLLGHEAETAHDKGLTGAPHSQIWEATQGEGRYTDRVGSVRNTAGAADSPRWADLQAWSAAGLSGADDAGQQLTLPNGERVSRSLGVTLAVKQRRLGVENE
jgi:hypothetical protein